MTRSYGPSWQSRVDFSARVAARLSDELPPCTIEPSHPWTPLPTVTVRRRSDDAVLAFAFHGCAYRQDRGRFGGPLVTGYEALKTDGTVIPPEAGPMRKLDDLAQALADVALAVHREAP